MFQAVGLGLLAAALSYPCVALLRRWAERREIFDVPNERSSHTRPTPRGGGLAIVVITLAGWLVYNLTAIDYWPLWPYFFGALLIAFISWLDDLRDVPTLIRLSVHGAAAALAILSFGYWHTTGIPLFNQLHLSWLGLPLTFLWVVGLTNAYNFMDGIDGIAGLQAVVAGLGWSLLGYVAHQAHLTAMGLMLTGACLGFLVHNWPPARIFMGDVGSAFLGYTFAVLPLMMIHVSQADSRPAIVGALLLWPFIFDSVFTFLRRAMHGENVFAAHRSHLYQRLVISGRSHLFVMMLYSALATVGVALALYWWSGLAGNQAVIMTLLPALCLLLWLYVARRERKQAAGKLSTQVAIVGGQ